MTALEKLRAVFGKAGFKVRWDGEEWSCWTDFGGGGGSGKTLDEAADGLIRDHLDRLRRHAQESRDEAADAESRIAAAEKALGTP